MTKEYRKKNAEDLGPLSRDVKKKKGKRDKNGKNDNMTKILKVEKTDV